MYVQACFKNCSRQYKIKKKSKEVAKSNYHLTKLDVPSTR